MIKARFRLLLRVPILFKSPFERKMIGKSRDKALFEIFVAKVPIIFCYRPVLREMIG